MPEIISQLNEQQLNFLNNLVDLAKIALPSLFTLLAVIIGARIGYRLSIRRFKIEKRLDFVRQQVTDFYSPLVGCRTRIRATSELRVELSISPICIKASSFRSQILFPTAMPAHLSIRISGGYLAKNVILGILFSRFTF